MHLLTKPGDSRPLLALRRVPPTELAEEHFGDRQRTLRATRQVFIQCKARRDERALDNLLRQGYKCYGLRTVSFEGQPVMIANAIIRHLQCREDRSVLEALLLGTW